MQASSDAGAELSVNGRQGAASMPCWSLRVVSRWTEAVSSCSQAVPQVSSEPHSQPVCRSVAALTPPIVTSAPLEHFTWRSPELLLFEAELEFSVEFFHCYYLCAFEISPPVIGKSSLLNRKFYVLVSIELLLKLLILPPELSVSELTRLVDLKYLPFLLSYFCFGKRG